MVVLVNVPVPPKLALMVPPWISNALEELKLFPVDPVIVPEVNLTTPEVVWLVVNKSNVPPPMVISPVVDNLLLVVLNANVPPLMVVPLEYVFGVFNVNVPLAVELITNATLSVPVVAKPVMVWYPMIALFCINPYCFPVKVNVLVLLALLVIPAVPTLLAALIATKLWSYPFKSNKPVPLLLVVSPMNNLVVVGKALLKPNLNQPPGPILIVVFPV